MWFISCWEFKVIALRGRSASPPPPTPWNFSLASELYSFHQEKLTFKITSEVPLCSVSVSFLMHWGSQYFKVTGNLVVSSLSKKFVHSSLPWTYILDLLKFGNTTSFFIPEMNNTTYSFSVFYSRVKVFKTMGLKYFSYTCDEYSLEIMLSHLGWK